MSDVEGRRKEGDTDTINDCYFSWSGLLNTTLEISRIGVVHPNLQGQSRRASSLSVDKLF